MSARPGAASTLAWAADRRLRVVERRGNAGGRPSRARKMTFRGHGAFVGGTANDMPPPP